MFILKKKSELKFLIYKAIKIAFAGFIERNESINFIKYNSGISYFV